MIQVPLGVLGYRISRIRAPKNSELAIFDDDVFLVSYPKSGNTWMRFLVANLIRKPQYPAIDFYNVHDYCPEWENLSGKIQDKKNPYKIFKSHQPYNDLFGKVVYIVRDPRDMYISYCHYMLPSLKEKWDLAQFIEKFDSPYGRWSTHVASWVNSEKGNSSDFCLIKYEDMLTNPVENLRKVAEFIGLPVCDEELKSAVGHSSFNNMKDIEKKKGRKHSRQDNITFVRKGAAGEWRDCFGKSEWDAFRAHEDIQLMERLGYLRN